MEGDLCAGLKFTPPVSVTLTTIQDTLEKAGVIFIDPGDEDGYGVWLRTAKEMAIIRRKRRAALKMKATRISERTFRRLQLFCRVREDNGIDLYEESAVSRYETPEEDIIDLVRHGLVECTSKGGELIAELTLTGLLVMAEHGSA